MPKRGRAAEGAKSAAWYDAAFTDNPRYARPAVECGWYPLWSWVAQVVAERSIRRVFDFGCGPGHLAEVLVGSGFPAENYLGVDFSPVAIGQARSRVPTFFFLSGSVDDIPTLLRLHRASAVAACEVLEHLEPQDELALLQATRGVSVIATVPSHDLPGETEGIILCRPNGTPTSQPAMSLDLATSTR